MRTRTKSTSCRSRWRSDRKKTDGMRKQSVDQPCGRLKWRPGFWFVSGRPPTGRVNPLRTATLSWTVTRLWTSSSGSRWATFLYRVEMSVATKDQLQSLAGVTEEQAGRVTAGGSLSSIAWTVCEAGDVVTRRDYALWPRQPILQCLAERLNRGVLAEITDLLIRHDVLKSHLPANCAYHL